MKVKKARKRLREVEELLTEVIDNYTATEPKIGELLGAAKKAVTDAMTTLEREPLESPPASAKKPAERQSTGGKKRLTPAAKKRRAIAKEEGIQTISGRRLRQTA